MNLMKENIRYLNFLVIMLIQSDNTAANKIIDIVGMEQINEDIIAMGLKNTKVK